MPLIFESLSSIIQIQKFQYLVPWFHDKMVAHEGLRANTLLIELSISLRYLFSLD